MTCRDLDRFYRKVDRATARLAAVHSERLQCRRGCSGCCVDGIRVFEVEADNIRRRHAELVETGSPHPEGACAFLDQDGACRIHPDRPYVCRTQGLPLRWFDQDPDGRTVELRDICPLNEDGAPVETLPAEQCWSIGPFESSLASLQIGLGGSELARVPLRKLFDRIAR